MHVDPSIIQSTGKKGKWFLAVCVHHTESVPAFKLQKVQMYFRRSGRLRLYCVFYRQGKMLILSFSV